MTKTIRKLLGYLVVISLLLSGVSALAEVGTVTVNVKKDKDKGFNNADGIVFQAFKVANSVGTGSTWEALSEYRKIENKKLDFPVLESGDKVYNTQQVDGMIEAIETHLQEYEYAPTAVATTVDGKAVFTDLIPGIYYIRKDPDSKTLLTGSASLIAVPYLNDQADPNGHVSATGPYNIVINAKYEFNKPEPTTFPVHKDWQDDGNFDGLQPAEITVHLYRRLNVEGSEKEAGFERTEKLNAGNGWAHTWTDLEKVTEDNVEYIYYVEEDKVDNYTTAPIIGGTVTNIHTPKYGAIAVTKQVTVNGQPTTGKLADGVYTFTITGPRDADYKANGTVKTSANYLDNVPFTITITDGRASTWTYDKLMPGTYTIKETSSLVNGMTIANGKAERTVEVKAGTTAAEPATGTYVNNLPVGSLKITKSVTVGGSSTTGTRVDGTYRFKVTGPSYPNGETVSITIRNGKSNSVQLDNLLLGEYEVTEIKTRLPSGVQYVSGDGKKTLVAANTVQSPLTFAFVNNTSTVTTPPSESRPTPTPTPSTSTEPPEETPTPTPTPSPTPAVNISGEKVWRDEGNVHNTRPVSIKVQLMRDGEEIRNITVTGGAGNRWSYSFGILPKVDETGAEYSYTVRETPVEGYTTTVRGTSVINDLVPQSSRNFTSFSGYKVWKDDDDSSGARPNYITVRLMRNGKEVDRRTVTAANGWQFSFQNVPLDDGYGNEYHYTIREDAVKGYVGRADDFVLTNSKLPEREVEELTEFSRYGTPLAGFGEPELEELLELYDYGTPLWGRPLQTGDDIPIYPIVFGGVGATALIALVVLMIVSKKRNRNAA